MLANQPPGKFGAGGCPHGREARVLVRIAAASVNSIDTKLRRLGGPIATKRLFSVATCRAWLKQSGKALRHKHAITRPQARSTRFIPTVNATRGSAAAFPSGRLDGACASTRASTDAGRRDWIHPNSRPERPRLRAAPKLLREINVASNSLGQHMTIRVDADKAAP